MYVHAVMNSIPEQHQQVQPQSSNIQAEPIEQRLDSEKDQIILRLKQDNAHMQQRIDNVAFRYMKAFGKDDIFCRAFPELAPLTCHTGLGLHKLIIALLSFGRTTWLLKMPGGSGYKA